MGAEAPPLMLRTLMGWQTTLLVFLAFASIASVVFLYGKHHWQAGTRSLRARLEAPRTPMAAERYDARELIGLPAPVRRYFENVLTDGQPVVTVVSVEHAGAMDMGKTSVNWKRFTSTQRVVMHRPGFVWDARLFILPGVPAHVHDAYIAGEGILHVALLGLVSMVDLRARGELGRGELMRFFAESAWYPTALLPSQGIRWSAVDDRSARATLEDGDLVVTMLFRFSEDGLIDAVRAEDRGRVVGGKALPTPWQGRFWNYAVRAGMRVPLEGEAAWLLPEGEKPYWRARIVSATYEFAS
jgi:hypothetical protein